MKKFIYSVIINSLLLYSLNAQNFQTEHIISYGHFDGPINTFLPIDIDNDGDYDILSATAGQCGGITWIENVGDLSFKVQHKIHFDTNSVSDVFSIDLDGDGDQDILSALNTNNTICWHKNSGDGSFSEAIIITNNTYSAQSVFAIDLDNDNDNDVLSASSEDNKIAWYENSGNGNFGSQKIITSNAQEANTVFAIDLDNDGDNDVLSSSGEDNKIAWYENIGDGTFGSQQVISTAMEKARCVYAADMDLDGDNDVLSASFDDGKIAWYENYGGGNFSVQKIITEGNGKATKVFASDLDNDGDYDVLSASWWTEQNLSWYENLGEGVFGGQYLISDLGGNQTVYTADIDLDGDNDIFSNSFWYENIGNGEFSSDNKIISAIEIPVSVVAVDADNDLDMDVFYSASFHLNSWHSPTYPKLGWFENDGSQFNENHYLATLDSLKFASRVLLYDIDNDGLMDIFAGFRDVIVWYHHEQIGEFVYQGIIDSISGFVESLYFADFDNDGDADILASSRFNDPIGWSWDEIQISWFENINNQTGWTSHNLYSDTSSWCRLQSVPADLDNDGDIDILSTDCDGQNLFLFENEDNGNFMFVEKEIPDDIEISYFAVADADADSDIDIFATVYFNTKSSFSTIWFENNGTNNFNNFHYIDENAWGSQFLVEDLDNDEFQDVVVNLPSDMMGFYYNDGYGNFVLKDVFEAENCEFWDISSADMDKDGDKDILFLSNWDLDKISWLENQYNSSVIEIPESNLTIFPNPTTNLIHVDNKGDFLLEIYNYSGSKVLTSQNQVTDVSKIANGIYLILIKSNMGKVVHSEKIIKM